MKLSIQKWGNGAVVRLQRPLLRQIRCEIGESLEVEVVDGGLFLRPVREPEFSLDELLGTCTPENVRLSDEDHAWLQDPPAGNEL
ncbi:MAG: AbrB family transcriptional regulator [Haliea sp.]|uniref:AbrB/MazE/SpoVT family DNA-binding domain-containing protein n=1 Tax=Marinobacter salarius TaxID=1420917 RepID=UPI0032EE8180